MYINFYLYSFLCLEKQEYLSILSLEFKNDDKVISLVESKTKNINLLIKLYNYYKKDNKLYNLINNDKNKHLFMYNIDLLKSKYNNELFNYFKQEFYNILNNGKSRDVYNKASVYINAISRLNDGYKLVEGIVIELKKSNYQKCSALFDEIKKSIK